MNKILRGVIYLKSSKNSISQAKIFDLFMYVFYSSKMHVLTRASVTEYGSQFEAGLLSSR